MEFSQEALRKIQIGIASRSEPEHKAIAKALSDRRKHQVVVLREHKAVSSKGHRWHPGPVECGDADTLLNGCYTFFKERAPLRIATVIRRGRKYNLPLRDVKEGEEIIGEYDQPRAAVHPSRVMRRFKGSREAFEIWEQGNEISSAKGDLVSGL